MNREAHTQPQPYLAEQSRGEVVDNISMLKNSIAAGSDCILAELFKHCGNALAMTIQLIVHI